ncbi:MAG: AraC family transcriptional regulator [Methylococcus sp.]|nr:MAG: AraC family transcriptional regulator [Methylococcus sp.]
MAINEKPDTLPPLVFGDARTPVSNDISEYVQRVARVLTGLEYYECLGSPTQFQSKSFAVDINGLRLVANANTPVTAKVGDSSDTTLMVPFQGRNISTVGPAALDWDANESAVLIPCVAREGHCTTRSNLNIDIDPRRLRRTAAAMLGREPDRVIDLGIDRPRRVALNQGPVSFTRLLSHYCGAIDALLEAPAALDASGIDEAIYRTLAMMFRPDLFIVEAVPSLRDRSGKEGAIDRLCEALRTSLDQRHTLTDLEERSGYSARNLQYLFRKRFGLSPLEWLREQRLQAARQRLLAGDYTTLGGLAYACGFTTASQFSTAYKTRFGETPGRRPGQRHRIKPCGDARLAAVDSPSRVLRSEGLAPTRESSPRVKNQESGERARRPLPGG